MSCQFSVIGGNCHKYNFCCDKHLFVATNMCLSHQNTFFFVTNVVLQQKFCRNKHILSGQNFCHYKYLARQMEFCHSKSFVTTSLLLSRQTCVCCDKSLSQQKYFVATSILLLRQTCVCHDKTFVTTKMILMAAPTNDSFLLLVDSDLCQEKSPISF